VLAYPSIFIYYCLRYSLDTGTLAEGGKKFDSSYDRNELFSFTFGLGQVIRGWDQALSNMSLGEKAKLHIPYQLAYGNEGSPPDIPPNADLIFDVEIVKINGKSKKVKVKENDVIVQRIQAGDGKTFPKKGDELTMHCK